jgi:hypothetical protein
VGAEEGLKGRFYGVTEPTPRVRSVGRGLLQLDNVIGGGALLALHHLELDPIALGEALEALRLDGRMVDEAVLASAYGRGEAEALGVVEPFDRSGSQRDGDMPYGLGGEGGGLSDPLSGKELG